MVYRNNTILIICVILGSYVLIVRRSVAKWNKMWHEGTFLTIKEFTVNFQEGCSLRFITGTAFKGDLKCLAGNCF